MPDSFYLLVMSLLVAAAGGGLFMGCMILTEAPAAAVGGRGWRERVGSIRDRFWHRIWPNCDLSITSRIVFSATVCLAGQSAVLGEISPGAAVLFAASALYLGLACAAMEFENRLNRNIWVDEYRQRLAAEAKLYPRKADFPGSERDEN